MAGSWKTGSFDNQHFMGHVAVQGIIGDRVNAGFRHDITRLVGLRHDRLLSKIDYFPVGCLKTSSLSVTRPPNRFANAPGIDFLGSRRVWISYGSQQLFLMRRM